MTHLVPKMSSRSISDSILILSYPIYPYPHLSYFQKSSRFNLDPDLGQISIESRSLCLSRQFYFPFPIYPYPHLACSKNRLSKKVYKEPIFPLKVKSSTVLKLSIFFRKIPLCCLLLFVVSSQQLCNILQIYPNIFCENFLAHPLKESRRIYLDILTYPDLVSLLRSVGQVYCEH